MSLMFSRSIEIEKVTEKRFLATRVFTLAALIAVLIAVVAMGAVLALVAALVPLLASARLRFGRRRLRRAPDDLIEVSTVEPYAAALRAIIDLDALAHGHEQFGIGAHGAFHVDSFLIAFNESQSNGRIEIEKWEILSASVRKNRSKRHTSEDWPRGRA
jgi:hypothetical protein